ncbi:S1/P1 nuclease [Marinicella sp. W31]|uniref:S1/P1 nuclease n=1 Tax=Marinicella sp. W31 TaxID=3023713 RepID=UPI003756B72C
MKKTYILLLLALYLCSPVQAYNAAGHEISALIAWELLDKAERQQIVAVLQQHPRFKQDFDLPRKPQDPEDQSAWIFARAASWPDAPRDREKYTPKMQKQYHRGRWHYTTKALIPEIYQGNSRLIERTLQKPRIKPSSEFQYDVIDAYKLNVERAASAQLADGERAIALTWVFHLLGDIHQPLHSTSFFTPERFVEGDRGGNDIPTKENAYAKVRNLHNYWDWILSNRHSFKYNLKVAEKLLADHADAGHSSIEKMDIETWVDESHAIALSSVYTDLVMTWVIENEKTLGPMAPLLLTEGYYQQAKKVSELQVARAGYRLAQAIRYILSKHKNGHQ